MVSDLVAFIKVPPVFEQALSLFSTLAAVDKSFAGAWALSTMVVRSKKDKKRTNLKYRNVKFFILVIL